MRRASEPERPAPAGLRGHSSGAGSRFQYRRGPRSGFCDRSGAMRRLSTRLAEVRSLPDGVGLGQVGPELRIEEVAVGHPEVTHEVPPQVIDLAELAAGGASPQPEVPIEMVG